MPNSSASSLGNLVKSLMQRFTGKAQSAPQQQPKAAAPASGAAGQHPQPAGQHPQPAGQHPQPAAAQPAAEHDNTVADEVDSVLAANPPTWQWVLLAFVILAAGTAVAYLVWRQVKPADFMPSSNYATYAGLFIMALAIERILEPFSGLFVPGTKQKKAASRATAARAKRAQVAAVSGVPHAVPVAEAQKAAAVAQTELHRSQGARAVLMWATAAVLAMLASASLGVFLLRSVEVPSPARPHAVTAPGPAKDPDRLLDLLVTGLVVGAGTKPLHDLITQVQTSSGNSKAKGASTAS